MGAREPATVLAGGACCPTPPILVPQPDRIDPSLIRHLDATTGHVDFVVPEMHCAACLSKLEGALDALPGVTNARANLTSHRVGVSFSLDDGEPDAMLTAIEKLGYTARPFDAAAYDAADRDEVGRELLRSLAVAGFAAANVMLLSVSVWAGAEAATRDLFHWLSALIALPAVVYAGRPFFRSAIRALAARSLNMDVPIAIGVTLAAGMSLYETAIGGADTYFDAAVTLLFFLLVGRYLDHRMRSVARSAAVRLMTLSARSAMRIEADGGIAHVPISEIAAGDRVRVAAGERVPVDGTVEDGASDIDRSMMTGEADPERIGTGGRVFAGTLNLTGPLVVRVTAKAGDTLLADIVRLMEDAERNAGKRVRLADRASQVYAPAVHLLALAAAIGWLVAGAGWHAALTTAISVLIITCPCAIGLAVPAVQAVASGLLLGRGVMLKDGGALERLASVDTVVFDKTGTITDGALHLTDGAAVKTRAWEIAAALGGSSRHPLARALAAAAGARGVRPADLETVAEHPGDGISAMADGVAVRLGRRAWTGGTASEVAGDGPEIWLRVGDEPAIRFAFADSLRPDAAATVSALTGRGMDVALLSGDRASAVAAIARRIGVAGWHAMQRPADKVKFLAARAAEGRRTLMVGDGINDAPALATAYVSMSPSGAADISQTAASVIFTGRALAPVTFAIDTARAAQALIFQNFALAIAYNLVAVPIAVMGFATPLVAAVAMSSSSIVVVANALRLRFKLRARKAAAPLPAAPHVEAAA